VQANPGVDWSSEFTESTRVGTHRAAFDLDGPGILNMEDDTGGTLSLLTKGMTSEQIVEFAAGLRPRGDGIAYEATTLPAGLTPFGEGWFGGAGNGWDLCWQRGEQLVCLGTESDSDGGPVLRAFEVQSLEPVDINGATGLMSPTSNPTTNVTWMARSNLRISLMTSGLSDDELLAIARSVAEVDAETFAAAWAAAGGT
jgi:hypothetical protein